MTPDGRPVLPTLECDIVMAGGVTSGIIYPGAVSVLARRYRFRSIGGTSVGAIAAAATAAAEYGRLTGSNEKSFKFLAGLPRSLGESDANGSRLLQLFTPEPTTVPVYRLISPMFRGGRKRDVALSILKTVSTPSVGVPVAIAALALVILVGLLASLGPVVAFAFGLLPALSMIVVVWVCALVIAGRRIWLPALRENGFGICTGLANPRADAGGSAFEGLTNWMHRTVQTAAGRGLDGKPLTFGDLWGAGTGAQSDDQFEIEMAPRSIELAMIASDISRNRTVQLPFIETPSPVYADLTEMARYFPKAIVNWLETHQGGYDKRVERPDGVVRLPPPHDLPIVFAARLSLSFPILLSAVPLKTPDFARRAAGGSGPIELRSLWLSDGGLTSNFPVHFFDSPMPARPTFCLNLIAFDAEIAKPKTTASLPGNARAGAADGPPAPKGNGTDPIEVARDQRRSSRARPASRPKNDPAPDDEVWGFVEMAKDNRIRPAPFTSFDKKAGIVGFFKTLVDTARFWSDNQMLVAPGVRERIVNIALRDDEGGLNLNMTSSMIDDLDYRGRAAGLLASARFDPDAQIDPETGDVNEERFENHRWVRYRNFMAAFEDMSRRFVTARRSSDAAAVARREAVLDDLIANTGKPDIGYEAPAKARPFFRDTTRALEAFAMTLADATRADAISTFDPQQADRSAHRKATPGAAPRPKMRLFMRPLADNDPRAESATLP